MGRILRCVTDAQQMCKRIWVLGYLHSVFTQHNSFVPHSDSVEQSLNQKVFIVRASSGPWLQALCIHPRCDKTMDIAGY